MKRAYDNEPKRLVRNHISSVINEHFKDTPIRMLELLGEGCGVDWYTEHCNVKDLSVLEMNKANYLNFMTGKGFKIQKEGKINLNCKCQNLYDFINPTLEFDVLNFDFCGWYTLDKYKVNKSSGEILEKAFKDGIITDGGLLATTFMIGGYTLDVSPAAKNALRDIKEIESSIKELASQNGYTLFEDKECGTYSPFRRTIMAYSLFMCVKK